MKFTEKKLFFRYFASSLLLIVSIISYSIPWGHWAYTLNTCPGYDCGCIFYGKAFTERFMGGEVQYCQFITIAQIIVFIVSVVLTCYHGYRVFIKSKKEQRKRASKANPLLAGKRVGSGKKDDLILDTQPSSPEPDPPSNKVTITLFIISLLMLILMFGTLVVAMDGFFASCNEYRRVLVRLLGVSSNVADVFNNRMACPSVFDFMDYLQPDRKNFNEPYDYVRRDRINTGVCLLLGKLTLTANTMNWIFLTIFNLSSLCKKTQCCRSK